MLQVLGEHRNHIKGIAQRGEDRQISITAGCTTQSGFVSL